MCRYENRRVCVCVCRSSPPLSVDLPSHMRKCRTHLWLNMSVCLYTCIHIYMVNYVCVVVYMCIYVLVICGRNATLGVQ